MRASRQEPGFFVCWTMDCESCRPEIGDTALGKRAIEGFCSLLDGSGFRGTLFLMPEEIECMPDLLGRISAAGHELALHLHPDASGYLHGAMGFYSYDEQAEILGKAVETFERVIGTRPVSARTGFGSANDSTFPALADRGFRQSSNSFPGRRMSDIASNWAGAPLFSHYAHAHNRFLEGNLDLVEIPMSVDWETMIWGGRHPQDLRVEYTDARNHSFAIRKIMRRQVSEGLPLKALVPLTHNIFEYSDPADFRRQTLNGMIQCMAQCAQELGVALKGATLSEAGSAFRKAAPR